LGRHGAGRSWATITATAHACVCRVVSSQSSVVSSQQSAVSSQQSAVSNQQSAVSSQQSAVSSQQSADAAGVNVSYCRGRCHQAGLVCGDAAGAASRCSSHQASQVSRGALQPCTVSHIMCVPHAHSHTHVAGGSPDVAGEGGREGWYSCDALGLRKHPGTATLHMLYTHVYTHEDCVYTL
jgi:uncharacterized protein with PIN domain